MSRHRVGACLAAIGILALTLRLANLGQNGYANEYYAAAVKSMLQNWNAFFFVSLDPGGFISVDKPPLAFWLQTISARIFGFSGFSLVLPQALAGTASCLVMYRIAARGHGQAAGLIAAAVLAITPISVAIDRTNNPDSIMVLLLLLAADQVLLSTREGGARKVLFAAILVGLAFNTKMLAALALVPTLALIYFPGDRLSARRTWLAVGAVAVLVAVSLSWALIVDSVDPAKRPYVGSSANNTVVDLIVGYNGLGRVLGQAPVAGPGGGAPPFGIMVAGGPPGFGGTPGLFRLANAEMAGNITWLIPLAFAGLLASIAFGKWRLPWDESTLQTVLWAGWLLTYGFLFSFGKGIVHPYYVCVLAPPIAGLVAVLSRYARQESSAAILAVGAILATMTWQSSLLSSDWAPWLSSVLLGGTVAASTWFALAYAKSARLSVPALGTGLAVLLVAPFAWSLTSVIYKGNAQMPTAGPELARGAGFMGPAGIPVDQAMVDYLRANRRGSKYLVAVSSAMPASALMLATGEPVIAMGGFIGGDPAMSPARLSEMVRSNQVRFVIVGGDGPMGGNQEVAQWVREHGRRVHPKEYGGLTRTLRFGPGSGDLFELPSTVVKGTKS